MNWLWRSLALLVVVLVAAFLLLRAPDTDPAAMRAKYGGAPSQFVALPNGPTVHYRDEGPRDAPAIVLVHGSNDDLHTWQPWVDRLTRNYRIIRFDQRGHGLTGPAADNDYRAQAFAADLERFAQRLALDRFVLAGSSMGGGVAARYAMLHPQRLRGLVLVDAAGAPIERSGDGNLAFAILKLPWINRVGMSVMPRPVIETSMRQSVADPSVVTPARVDRIWELARYPGNRDATLARVAQEYSAFTASEVAAIEVPTLVMWGEEDRLVPFAAAGWFGKALPDALLVSYPGIGHLPMEEAPDRSARDLMRFVDGLPE